MYNGLSAKIRQATEFNLVPVTIVMHSNSLRNGANLYVCLYGVYNYVVGTLTFFFDVVSPVGISQHKLPQ